MAFSLLRSNIRPIFTITEQSLKNSIPNKTWNKTITVNAHFATKHNVAVTENTLFRIKITNLSNQKFLSTIREYGNKRNRPEKRIEYESDSDSDDERRERGKSQIWRRKMRTIHQILDVNKDGVISYDDFKLLADRFVALGHLSEQCQKEFYETIEKIWTELWGEITPYNLITMERYMDDMYHALNDKDRRHKVHSFLPYLFKAVDKDKSGKISVEEFKLFFRCLGLTAESAVTTFSIIDKNEDGLLGLDEFVKIGRQFLVNEDENNVSQVFWGPLAH